MERGLAPFHVDRKGCHLILDEIPAWVCAQCGEAFFEESEVEAVQVMLRSIDDQRNKMMKVA